MLIELVTLRPDSTASRGRVSDAGGPRKFDHATRAVQLDFGRHRYCVGEPRTTSLSKGVDKLWQYRQIVTSAPWVAKPERRSVPTGPSACLSYCGPEPAPAVPAEHQAGALTWKTQARCTETPESINGPAPACAAPLACSPCTQQPSGDVWSLRVVNLASHLDMHLAGSPALCALTEIHWKPMRFTRSPKWRITFRFGAPG